MSTFLVLVACGSPDPGPPPTSPTSPTADTGTSPATGDTGTPPVPTGDTGAPPPPGPCGQLQSGETFGGTGQDGLNAIGAGADGALTMAMSFTGPLTLGAGGPAEVTLVPEGYDAAVVHHAPDGSLAWARQLAGSRAKSVYTMGATSDGGAVVAGTFQGPTTFALGEPDAVELTSVGYEDGFLARLDAAGALLWVEPFGGGEETTPYRLTVLADDSVVVVGNHVGAARFGAGEAGETVLPVGPSANGGFVARFGPDGALAWAEGFTGPGFPWAYDVALDPGTGELVVAGSVSDGGAVFPSGALLASAANPVRGFVARWGVDGGDRSVVPFEGTPWSVDVASDGAVWVVGSFSDGAAVFGAGEPNETTLSSGAYNEGFVARYEPDGALAWALQTVTQWNAWARVVSATDDGGAVVFGEFDEEVVIAPGPSEIVLAGGATVDVFGARFDATGAPGCAVHVSGPGGDTVRDLARLADGTFASAGSFEDYLTFAVDTLEELIAGSEGAYDGYLATWSFGP